MAPTTTRRAALAGAAALLARPAAAQQVTTLRYYSLAYPTGGATLAAELPLRTGGRYRVEQVIGFDSLEAALGKDRAAGGEGALLEGARRGDLDLVAGAAFTLDRYVPETRALYVPFLVDGVARGRAVLDGPVGQDLLGRFAAQGLVGLAWTEDGLRHVANNRRPIRTPDDLKGLRLRTPPNPVVVETFRSLGAEVVPMPMGKAVFEALERGTLDGLEVTVHALAEWERLFRSLRYLSLTGHSYSPAIIAMSGAAWDRLAEGDRPVFVEAARLGAQNDREDNDDLEAAGVANLMSAGLAINADVDRAAFRAALAPAYAEWREQFGDLIDRIQASG